MGGCVCLLLLRVEQIMSPSAHASDFVSSLVKVCRALVNDDEKMKMTGHKKGAARVGG